MNLQYQLHSGLLVETRLWSLFDLLTTVFDDQSRDELLTDLKYHRDQAPMLTLLTVDKNRL